MSKGKAPKAPDPYKTAEAQTQSNQQTAAYNASLNRVNQSSPFGSVNWSQSGTDPTTGAPIWSQSTQLSAPLQSLFDSQIGTQQGISDAITGALGRLPTGAFDPSGIDTSQIAKTSFDRQMANLTPQFEEGWRNLEGTLSDRGIPIGAEVWNNETNRYDTARQGSIAQAARTADMDALNEHQRQYSNALQEYNLPISQLSALMGNSQSVGNPQFSGVPQAQSAGTDVASGIWNKYNADQQAYQNNQNQLWSGALGLGQLGLAAFSDRRLKRDIKRIGAMPSGLPIYSYRYLWSDAPQIGVMAQEALHFAPGAVSLHPSGYLTVRYDLIG